MRHIKTLGLAGLAALAIMGVMAASALASGGPSGTKMDVTTPAGKEDVHITAISPELLLTANGLALNCNVTLTATITKEGLVHIIEKGSSVAPGNALCSLVKLKEFNKEDKTNFFTFWTGKICGMGGFGAALWIDVNFSSPLGSFTGWVEVPLFGSETAGFTGGFVSTNIGTSTATLLGTFNFSETVHGTATEHTFC